MTIFVIICMTVSVTVLENPLPARAAVDNVA